MIKTHNFYLPKIHLLIPLTIILILGITWQAAGQLFWLPLLGCIAYFVLFQYKTQTTLAYALALSVFLAGALRYAQQQTVYENFYYATENKLCSLEAHVNDIELSYRYPGQTIITATIEELKNNDTVLKNARGLKVKIATKNPIAIQVDDTIGCEKLFFRKISSTDYKNYLIKENLGAHLYTKETIKTLRRPTLSINRWFRNKRNQIIEQLKNKLSPKTFTLLASIFFGKKQISLTHMDVIKDHFKVWGILHYLARSGLHLLLFVILWSFIMSLMPLPFTIKQITLLTLTLGYMALSWSSISFIRAITLFIFYKICLFFDLQINALYLLALTCILVLLYNPHQLFFLDFQLSFILTFALAWLSSLKSIAFPHHKKLK